MGEHTLVLSAPILKVTKASLKPTRTVFDRKYNWGWANVDLAEITSKNDSRIVDPELVSQAVLA